METVLERASGLLSELTSYAAVVVGPSHDTATIRSVQLVGLSPLHALLVVVLSDGAVEKRTHRPAGRDLRGHARPRRQPARLPPGGAHAHPALGRPAERIRRGRPARDRGAPGLRLPRGRPWSPTRCSSAARPAWPSRSTPSRRCAPSWPSSSSSWSSSRCCATSSTAGSRWPSAPSTGSSRSRRAPSSWRRSPSTGRTSARWGCSVPTRMDYARAMAAAHVVGERLGQRISGGHDGRH